MEILKGVKTTAVRVESFKGDPSFIQFAGKQRCYIFDLRQFKENETFKEFLTSFLKNRKNLKIIFDLEKFTKIINLILKVKNSKWQSIYEIKQNLYFSKKKSANLNFCCRRLFSKINKIKFSN